MNLGIIGKKLEHKLQTAFDPVSLAVIDESELHRGHAGARPGGESHFRVRIVATAFTGKSRVERHRMINQVLAAELRSEVHALAIEAAPPEAPLPVNSPAR